MADAQSGIGRELVDIGAATTEVPPEGAKRSATEPSMTLVVQVVDPAGTPVPNVPVRAQGNSWIKSDDPVVSGISFSTYRATHSIGRSNAAGIVTATLPVDDYMITVLGSEEAWTTETVRVESPNTEEEASTKIVLYPLTSDLRLLVSNDGGEPIDGAQVTSTGSGLSITNVEGVVMLTSLPTGKPVPMRIGSLPREARLVTSGRKNQILRPLSLGLNQRTIVLQRQGRLVMRASPLVLDRLGEAQTVTAFTGERRHYLSRNTPEITVWVNPGNVTLRAVAREPLRLATEHKVEIKAGATHVWTIDHLQGQRVIEGLVTDRIGHAIWRVQVQVSFDSETRQAIQTRTDRQGRFRFAELPNESMRVTVVPDPGAFAWTLPQDSRASLTVEPTPSIMNTTKVNFVLEPGYSIRGFVRDGGEPDKRTDATIALVGPLPKDTQRTTKPTPHGSRWAMPGEFLFSNLAEGTYRLWILDEDASQVQIVLGPGLPNGRARIDLAIN